MAKIREAFLFFGKNVVFLLSQNLTFAADLRRGVRVVEGARLESVYVGNCIAGSNPALSAYCYNARKRCFYVVSL